MSAIFARAEAPPAGRRRSRRLLVAFVAGVAALGAATLRPSPIDPLAIAPEPLMPLAGPLAPNHHLHAVERLPLGSARGGEDVAVDAGGRIYTGVEDGRILRLSVLPDGTTRVTTFARTGGRPLGLRFAPEGGPLAGALIAAVAHRGLLAIDPEGSVRELATAVDGKPLRVTNNLDVSRRGTVYFTDSSQRHEIERYRLDLLEARPTGRLLAFDPASGTTRELASGLCFPNGVALTAREDAVLVAETGRSRILRLTLTPDGRTVPEPLVSGLPGYPDNLARDDEGAFWLALFTVRNRLLDLIHPHPWIKARIAALPRPLQPEAARYGFVLRFDEHGKILDSLQDPGGRRVPNITSARPAGGAIFLGSLEATWLGRLTLAEVRNGDVAGGTRK